MSRLPMRLGLALAVLATLATSVHAQSKRSWMSKPARAIALVGGTVHTVTGGTLENATVLVQGDRIAAVGTQVTLPAGAQVVDCRGKHVYPGFVLANSQLGLTEVSTVTGSNDNAETGNLNPNARAEVQINPDSDLLPVTRINGITSALSVPGGGALSGTSALVHLSGWTHEDMTLRAPVGLHMQWPNMTPSRGWWEQRSDEEQAKARDEAIAAIRRAFEDARAYWKARDAEGKPGAGRHDHDVRWDAMGKALRGEIPVFVHADRLNQIRAALQLTDELGLKRLVIVGGYDAWRMADELKQRDIAVIVGGVLATPNRRHEPYDEAYVVAARLHAAGVSYCIADDGRGGAHNARNLPHHASMAVAFGLPPAEGLKSVTIHPARILGAGDLVGSIEPGKLADLQVTDGDPLMQGTRCLQVMIAGQLDPMESRQTRLFQKYDARPRGAKARPR